MNSNEQNPVAGQDGEPAHGHHYHHHSHHRRHFWKIPFIIAAVILIKSAVVMVLWNAIIPDLFNGPILNYVQAIGLSVLVKLLVGFGGGKHFGRHGGPPWAKGRWGHLSPEQRKKLREDIRRCCGH